MQKNKKIIEDAFQKRSTIFNGKVNHKIYETIINTIEKLDNGTLRVAEKINGHWITNEWIKKAIILSFYILDNEMTKYGDIKYFDKIPNKFVDWNNKKFKEEKIRVVAPASVRKGAYIAKNTILMPSFVNIGSYIDEGTMVDTWATVGSCAQIGKNVHLSGGVGIGGVLEPLQNNPTIIENNCFIGARSEIVEGVIVEEGSVISMGVFIGKSTKIYDRITGEIFYGKVPSGSVVISGNLISEDKKYSTYSAIIIKKVDDRTMNKIQINEILRNSSSY